MDTFTTTTNRKRCWKRKKRKSRLKIQKLGDKQTSEFKAAGNSWTGKNIETKSEALAAYTNISWDISKKEEVTLSS